MKYINIILSLVILNCTIVTTSQTSNLASSSSSQNLITTNWDTKFSQYVTVRDGTRLAVTVYLPQGLPLNQSVPTLFSFTRYGREDDVNPDLFPNDLYLTQNGYAVVAVDARGTAASFGARSGEFTPTEVLDMKDIVDWVVAQNWCNGNVGAYGASYSGTTAELLAATGHSAVKAVAIGWDDFDIYHSPGRPYGALTTNFLSDWSAYNSLVDSGMAGTVAVDADINGGLLSQAIAEHVTAPLYPALFNAEYRDSIIGDVANGRGEFSYYESSPVYWKDEIQASDIPMLVFSSWLDAGSTDGSLKRFNNLNNSQKLIIMGDNHGSTSLASPYQVSDTELAPSLPIEAIAQVHLDFFDHFLKGMTTNYTALPNILYYNFAQEDYLGSDIWPPQNSQLSRYYFHTQGLLSQISPTNLTGQDSYMVDYSVSTGQFNRWYTQGGNPILNLNNRGAMDAKMLTYTTQAVAQDTQITGTPIVSLKMSSDLAQGLVLVYLEDVDANGQSRYLSEGGLMLKHRKVVTNPDLNQIEPYHSFFEADASPMPANQMQEVTFQMLPISVLIQAGHKIRIAIAGADQGTFDRVPAIGSPTWKISRNASQLSFVDLPIICSINCSNDTIYANGFE